MGPTPSGSYGDVQLFLVEEDPTRTIIGIFACTGRTTDASQISWKTSPHESFVPTGLEPELWAEWLEVKSLYRSATGILAYLELNCVQYLLVPRDTT